MENKTLSISLILSLIAFLLVTFIFTAENGFTYDNYLTTKLSAISSKSLDSFMNIISLLGSSEVILLLTVLIGFVFLLQKNWLQLFLFFVLSVGGVALNFFLKMAFQRERPDGEVSMIEVFNYTLEIPSYSFPSGHTMRATIFLLFLLYLITKYLLEGFVRTTLIGVLILVIISVAISRVYLEAHFAFDTISAISISIGWFSLITMIFNKIEEKKRPTYRRTIGM